jgi:hypothetical protein
MGEIELPVPLVAARAAITQPLSPSSCHALTTCTAASPPAISQVDPNNSQARPFPKQVLRTLSHRCQRTTIIEQYTLRFVSSYLNFATG